MRTKLVTLVSLIILAACSVEQETASLQSLPAEPTEPAVEGDAPTFSVNGETAQAIMESMWTEEVDGKKTIDGSGTVSCYLVTPSIPDGAQGIFLPTANCNAYPQVQWPRGVQGIVAPWFSVSGRLGYELFKVMPAELNEHNAKTMFGNWSITCQENDMSVTTANGPSHTCDFSYVAKQDWRAMDDFANAELFDAIWGNADDRGQKNIEGKGTISCTLQVAEIPDGAQGIAAPSANCVGYPEVNFPDGVQGIVAPWFQLSGLAGYQLFQVMPVDMDQNRQKSVNAEFDIACTQWSNERASCLISTLH